MPIDVNKMINIDQLDSSNIESVDEVILLSKEAQDFLAAQSWCKRITNGFFDRGWGYTLAVFYFLIEPNKSDVPNSVWVITGDLPPAYIDVSDNPNGACAIHGYVIEMQEWVDAVLNGDSVDGLIPVNVPPERKYAKMLQERLKFIRKNILSNLKKELEAG
jgi:hypothetical protein